MRGDVRGRVIDRRRVVECELHPRDGRTTGVVGGVVDRGARHRRHHRRDRGCTGQAQRRESRARGPWAGIDRVHRPGIDGVRRAGLEVGERHGAIDLRRGVIDRDRVVEGELHARDGCTAGVIRGVGDGSRRNAGGNSADRGGAGLAQRGEGERCRPGTGALVVHCPGVEGVGRAGLEVGERHGAIDLRRGVIDRDRVVEGELHASDRGTACVVRGVGDDSRRRRGSRTREHRRTRGRIGVSLAPSRKAVNRAGVVGRELPTGQHFTRRGPGDGQHPSVELTTDGVPCGPVPLLDSPRQRVEVARLTEDTHSRGERSTDPGEFSGTGNQPRRDRAHLRPCRPVPPGDVAHRSAAGEGLREAPACIEVAGVVGHEGARRTGRDLREAVPGCTVPSRIGHAAVRASRREITGDDEVTCGEHGHGPHGPVGVRPADAAPRAGLPLGQVEPRHPAHRDAEVAAHHEAVGVIPQQVEGARCVSGAGPHRLPRRAIPHDDVATADAGRSVELPSDVHVSTVVEGDVAHLRNARMGDATGQGVPLRAVPHRNVARGHAIDAREVAADPRAPKRVDYDDVHHPGHPRIGGPPGGRCLRRSRTHQAEAGEEKGEDCRDGGSASCPDPTHGGPFDGGKASIKRR